MPNYLVIKKKDNEYSIRRDRSRQPPVVSFATGVFRVVAKTKIRAEKLVRKLVAVQETIEIQKAGSTTVKTTETKSVQLEKKQEIGAEMS